MKDREFDFEDYPDDGIYISEEIMKMTPEEIDEKIEELMKQYK